MDTNTINTIQVISTSIVTIATIVLAVLTGIYVKLTSAMVAEMKSTRNPSVFVDLEFPDRGDTVLSVGNSGQAPAKNIKFDLKENIPWVGKFRNMNILEKGVSYLPPGRILKFNIGTVDWKKLEETGGTLEVDITFESETGKTFNRETFFDLSQYIGVLFDSFRDSGLVIAEAIKDTERSRQTYQRAWNISFHTIKKLCPFCQESIPTNAKKCSHCHEFLPETAEEKKT